MAGGVKQQKSNMALSDTQYDRRHVPVEPLNPHKNSNNSLLIIQWAVKQPASEMDVPDQTLASFKSQHKQIIPSQSQVEESHGSKKEKKKGSKNEKSKIGGKKLQDAS